MTERLAGWCARRPWRTLALWLLALLVAGGLNAGLLGDALSGDEDVTAETESRRADRLASERLDRGPSADAEDVSEIVVMRSLTATAGEPGFDSRVRLLRTRCAKRAPSAWSPPPRRPTGAWSRPDGDATALLVTMGRDGEDEIEGLVAAVRRFDRRAEVEASITGEFTLDADFSTLAGDDLRNGELRFGLPIALVILLLVFGSVVAGLVPLLLGIVSIGVALALLAVVGQAFPLSVFATNMLTAIGLALGIDYALFILSRYREERRRGREPLDAIEVAGATASRAVLFSGFAFTLAMVGLLLVPSTIMRSLAAGAIAAGLVSVVAALTLLPAALALLGDRVDALRIPFFGRAATANSGGFWARIVGGVLRRPLLYLLGAVVALLAMASPLLRLDTGEAGISTLPDRLSSKQGYLALNEEFPGQTTDPVEIVVAGDVDSPALGTAVGRLERSLAAEPALGEPVTERSAAGDLAVLRLPVRGDPNGPEATETVERVRAERVPAALDGVAAEALVTGETAAGIDVSETMDRWLPVVLAFVLGLSLVLLTIAFRSIVVAVKAVAANLLAVAAAYGLLVLVFVDGVGAELLGFEQVETIESWVPLFLFAVLFGLSMDYHVFLLSRIRERFAETGDNDEAIVHGISSTGRIITGAALIIVAVFSGFARGDLVMFQQMGFGCGVALLLDATLVRMVLIPAAMKLLGDANWYLPGWLAWLPEVTVEGRVTDSGRSIRREPGTAAGRPPA